MDIQFVWSTSTSDPFRDDLESEIRMDIEDATDISPCHSGTLIVRLSSTGPLETTIMGEVVCPCGHTLKKFSGPSDGSRLHWL